MVIGSPLVEDDDGLLTEEDDDTACALRLTLFACLDLDDWPNGCCLLFASLPPEVDEDAMEALLSALLNVSLPILVNALLLPSPSLTPEDDEALRSNNCNRESFLEGKIDDEDLLPPLVLPLALLPLLTLELCCPSGTLLRVAALFIL